MRSCSSTLASAESCSNLCASLPFCTNEKILWNLRPGSQESLWLTSWNTYPGLGCNVVLGHTFIEFNGMHVHKKWDLHKKCLPTCIGSLPACLPACLPILAISRGEIFFVSDHYHWTLSTLMKCFISLSALPLLLTFVTKPNPTHKTCQICEKNKIIP